MMNGEVRQGGEADPAGVGAWAVRVERYAALLPAGAHSRELMEELVSDWRREVGDDPDAAEILAVLEGEAQAVFRDASPTARLEWVNSEVLDRRLRVLSRRSLHIARGLADGSLDDEVVREEGRAILGQVEGLVPSIDGVGPVYRPALTQALEDLVLEGLYLVERKAMSRRFEEVFRDAGSEGPPAVF